MPRDVERWPWQCPMDIAPLSVFTRVDDPGGYSSVYLLCCWLQREPFASAAVVRIDTLRKGEKLSCALTWTEDHSSGSWQWVLWNACLQKQKAWSWICLAECSAETQIPHHQLRRGGRGEVPSHPPQPQKRLSNAPRCVWLHAAQTAIGMPSWVRWLLVALVNDKSTWPFEL